MRHEYAVTDLYKARQLLYLLDTLKPKDATNMTDKSESHAATKEQRR